MKDIHMGHLKGCLIDFVKAFFEVDEVEARFRPHFFPFTEPSAEMDVKYTNKGETIEIGAGDRWMEILGSGMVHPAVFEACGYDPEVYTGWAFVLGQDETQPSLKFTGLPRVNLKITKTIHSTIDPFNIFPNTFPLSQDYLAII